MTKGERIKSLREKIGLSSSELALKIDVSKQNMYKYENDIITNIPSDKIELIAKCLNVSPAYIMGWDKYSVNENKPEEPELEENIVVYHRDGKTVRKKMTKEKMEMLASMIDAIPEDDNPDL